MELQTCDRRPVCSTRGQRKMMNDRIPYHEIRAYYTEDTIRVYQAYNRAIAEEAAKLGTFGKFFKLDRMTWIKPSFLWMMYRCGWGTKENQEHILAIDLKREAFDFAVQNAVASSYTRDMGISCDEWQEQIKRSEIRCQWDPERDICGRPLDYRSLQLGLRGDAVRRYVREWIVKITDLTEYVQELDRQRKTGADIRTRLPEERVYLCNSNRTGTEASEKEKSEFGGKKSGETEG